MQAQMQAAAQRKRKWDVNVPAVDKKPGPRKWDVNVPASAPPSVITADVVARAQQGAAAMVHKFNADLMTRGMIVANKVTQQQGGPVSLDQPCREVVINDADPTIRYQLTKKQTQEEILRKTQCVVITRGRYRQPGVPTAEDDKEKPLHIYISPSASLTDLEAKRRAVEAAVEHAEMLMYGRSVTQTIWFSFSPPVGFNLAGRVRGPDNSYLQHIQNQTGATIRLQGRGCGAAELESNDALHILISCNDTKGLTDARDLCNNLVSTVKIEYLRTLPPPPPGHGTSNPNAPVPADGNPQELLSVPIQPAAQPPPAASPSPAQAQVATAQPYQPQVSASLPATSNPATMHMSAAPAAAFTTPPGVQQMYSAAPQMFQPAPQAFQ